MAIASPDIVPRAVMCHAIHLAGGPRTGLGPDTRHSVPARRVSHLHEQMRDALIALRQLRRVLPLRAWPAGRLALLCDVPDPPGKLTESHGAPVHPVDGTEQRVLSAARQAAEDADEVTDP